MLRTTHVVLAFFISAFVPSNVHAQSDSERGVARELAQEGDGLQRAGRYAEALEKFERAEKIVAAPTHLVRIAECQAALGKLVEAAESYRHAQRIPVPAEAPAVLLRAEEEAQRELVALEPRVPKLTLTITPRAAVGLEVEIDGHPLNVAVVGEPIPLDPGRHEVVVRASGGAAFRGDVRLADGEVKELAVALGGGLQHGGTTNVGRPVGLVAAGAGVVGLVVGSVLGLVAKSTYDDALAYCPNGPPSPCGREGVAGGETAHNEATAATVAFVLGGVLLAGGTTLFLVASRERAISIGPTGFAEGPGVGVGLDVRGAW